MLELLSPCGNEQSFYSAIFNGANALYLGLDDFSARKNAQNFTLSNLPYYINYAHLFDVKVYVTLNTIIKDSELDSFFEYIKSAYLSGVDGIIIQDFSIAKLIHSIYPQIPLHLSTQGGVNNIEGALLAKEYGFSRVVLSRETPIKDVKEIAKIIETEVFIQGALCTAFSGQCYLSSFAGNKSGNRGLCKQPCRQKYTLTCGKETKSGYMISLKDLAVKNNIFDLIDAGVTSFKIEGRMRKPSYVGGATRYYRELLDGVKTPPISLLTHTYNRGDYTCGLTLTNGKDIVSDKVQSHLGETIAQVKSVNKHTFTIDKKFDFINGDGGKILRGGYEVGSFTFDNTLKYNGDCKVGDSVNITTDNRLENDILSAKKLVDINVYGEFFAGKNAKITANFKGKEYAVIGDILENAQNRPTTKDEIIYNLKKVDTLPFNPKIQVETDNVFILKSTLNKLRRELYQKVFDSAKPNNQLDDKIIPTFSGPIKSETGLIAIDNDFLWYDGDKIDYYVLSPDDYNDIEFINKQLAHLKDKNVYLYLPSKLSKVDMPIIDKLLPLFDGLYVEGFGGIKLAKDKNKKMIIGSGLNVYNKIDYLDMLTHSNIVCLSKELSNQGIKDIGGGFKYTLGSIKVMDLMYCPFNKTCDNCNRQNYSTLYDGNRTFILRRVKLSTCRFEVYNSNNLVGESFYGNVFNGITLTDKQKNQLIDNIDDIAKQKEIVKNYTLGHANKPLE